MKNKKKMPKNFISIAQRYPKLSAAISQVGIEARAAGPIDNKTAHLIQLAAAASIRSEGSVHSHARRAVEAGASPEEIRHAIVLLASTIGHPMVAAALSWVDDVL